MRKAPLAVAAVALVAGLAHVSSLPGAYTFDDRAIVEENPRLAPRDLAGVRELIASNYWGPGAESERLWRPVPLATYALERMVARRPAPLLSHAVNVALHAAAAVLALALFLRVVPPRAAVLGALVFAAHPLHAEAVGGIVGRAEVLALGFGLAALALHVRGRGVLARLGEAVALFLALGSKESAVAVVPIAVLLDLVVEGRLRPRKLALPLGTLAAYTAARVAAIGALVARPGGWTLGDKTWLERLPYTLGVYRDAWLDVLWPVHGTSAHFPLPDTSVAGLALAVGLQVVVVALTGWLLARALRGERLSPELRGVALGFAGFELALLPVANLVPIGVVYAERLLYAPTLWASLVAGALAGRVARSAPGALAAGLVVGALVLGSSRNDAEWQTDGVLWRASVRRFPEEPRARLALAEVLLNERAGATPAVAHDLAVDAVKHAHFAAERFPATQPLKAKANVILAQALLAAAPGNANVRAEAERALGKALELDPRSEVAWLGLAQLEIDADAPDWRRVLAAASRACAVAPTSYRARWNLGFALWKSGDLASAKRVLTEAVALDANPGEAFFYRAEILWGEGERAVAGPDYVRAVECLAAKGKQGEARAAVAARSLELGPAERDRIQEVLGP